MNSHQISFRIRYGETDQMGVVYHGNYAQYLEMGRVEWLRSLGVSYKNMEDDGIILPVIHLQITYIKSAIYDDLLKVETTLVKRPMVKIEFDYKLYNENQELVATANTVLAFMDKTLNKPIRCPRYILEKLGY